MSTLERVWHQFVALLSHWLDSVVGWVERMSALLRGQLKEWGVAADYRSAIVAAAWVVAALVIVRALPGAWRLLALALAALILARAYGALPGV